MLERKLSASDIALEDIEVVIQRKTFEKKITRRLYRLDYTSIPISTFIEPFFFLRSRPASHQRDRPTIIQCSTFPVTRVVSPRATVFSRLSPVKVGSLAY